MIPEQVVDCEENVELSINEPAVDEEPVPQDNHDGGRNSETSDDDGRLKTPPPLRRQNVGPRPRPKRNRRPPDFLTS